MNEVLTCPWCDISIVIETNNCGIYRCGVYRDNLTQVNPHLSEIECAKLGDTIYGCGKPFQFFNKKLIKCAYV